MDEVATMPTSLRNRICDFVRVASDNIGTCRRRMPPFDDGGQTSTAGDGTALRAHAVPVATRTHDRRRAHQGDEVARLRHRRAGVETGVGCAALGTATGQGSPAGPRPVRPRIRTARHRVPDLPPRDGIACRSKTLVARRYAAVGL